MFIQVEVGLVTVLICLMAASLLQSALQQWHTRTEAWSPQQVRCSYGVVAHGAVALDVLHTMHG